MLLRVFSKFWIENRRDRSTKKPNRAEKPTEVMTPMGALQDALRVSSERCADASKPVKVYCDMSAPQHARYAGLARTLHPGVGAVPVPSLKVPNTKLALWWVGALAKSAMAMADTPRECSAMEVLLR